MKGKLRWLVLGLAVTVVVVAGLLDLALNLHGRTLTARQPPTLQELDRLAKTATTDPPQGASPPQPVHEEKAETGASLPAHLAGLPSPEALTERFMSKKAPPERIATDIKALQVLQSSVWAIGAKETAGEWAWLVGRTQMLAGQWDDARPYFYEALENAPPRLRDDICVDLAWLETDPEKAARLLEMSCNDTWSLHALERPWKSPESKARARQILGERLANCVDLARATGSDALADHYLQRLREMNPEMARDYDSGTPSRP